MFIILLLIIGVIVGALTGITGASAVLIVVPALSLLGLTFKESVGSSLLVDIITTVPVTIIYLKHKNLDVKLSLLLGTGAIIGAQIGARIAFITSEKMLELLFIIFVLYMTYVSFKRSKIKNHLENKKKFR